MVVLGLDSGLGGFSAAVVRDRELLASVFLPGNVALEHGLPAVAQVLHEAALTPKDLDRIAVGIGPGSFTGVRIAVSYAKSLAQGWRVPLCGVNSFDALEEGADLPLPLLTVVRGRPGVVSVRFRSGVEELRASGYAAQVLERLPAGGGRLAVLGEAEDVLPGLAERGWSVEMLTPALTPTAYAVAAAALGREPARTPHEIRADYGELPAAKVPDFRK